MCIVASLSYYLIDYCRTKGVNEEIVYSCPYRGVLACSMLSAVETIENVGERRTSPRQFANVPMAPMTKGLELVYM